jgi:hypothetical protein
MCGAGRGGAAMWGGGGAAMCGAGRGGAAMCGGAGLAGGAAGCGAGAARGGGPGFFCACEGALVVSASKTATKSDATNPLIRTMSLLSAGFGKQREAGMKVSNPRSVTESKSRDHRKRGGQHSYPPPDFELSVADARQKWGSLSTAPHCSARSQQRPLVSSDPGQTAANPIRASKGASDVSLDGPGRYSICTDVAFQWERLLMAHWEAAL